MTYCSLKLAENPQAIEACTNPSKRGKIVSHAREERGMTKLEPGNECIRNPLEDIKRDITSTELCLGKIKSNAPKINVQESW